MKKLFTLLALVITLITTAQAPQGFNYQATVRNSAGALIINQNVNFKFNIMLNSATSLPIFSETHMAPTDDLGHINLIIGQGTATIGSFSTINWANGNYYLGIELNTGSGYVAMGTTQLLSVPYALYANSAGNAQAPTPSLGSVLAVNNNANNLQIKNVADPTEAQDAATKAYIDLNSSPWVKNTTNDSISYDKRVFIGSSTNQFAPSLTVYGTDTGPTSPSAKFIRSRYRNNVLLFETSEPDNNYLGSIGLIEAGENNQWPNSFVIGINNGINWYNPFRIYYDNNAIRFGFGNDNYYNTNIFGNSSLSLGYNSSARGNYSTAVGVDNIASGINSTALGINSLASAQGAIVLGVNSIASGINSTAIGLNSNAIGVGSSANGLNVNAIGDFSTAIGFNTTSNSLGETVVGMYNQIYSPLGGTTGYNSEDNIFTVGNGTGENSRSNALTIKKSGKISVEGNQIKNLATPTDPQDAATKQYVDLLQSQSVPNFQEVLDSGNIANKTTNTPEDASLRINTIGGSTSGNFYYGIRSHIDGTNGNNRAILAASNGVSSGTNTGLSSYASNGVNNSAIYARAYDSTTGSNYGVYGVANGNTGADNRAIAGYADAITTTGKNYGLTGVARGSEVFNIAVGAYAELGNTSNGINYGVVARASSINTNGTNIGVYSSASSGATNIAGYFSGDVTITGTLVQPSDRKLKKEIKPIQSALDKINQLSPVTYYYNTNSNINLPSKLQYGFIAQELEDVFPELVINQSIQTPPTEKNNNKISEIKEFDDNVKTNSSANNEIVNAKEEFKGINYTGLISILTEGIKEQQVLIEELKRQNELLKQRIITIENKLDK